MQRETAPLNASHGLNTIASHLGHGCFEDQVGKTAIQDYVSVGEPSTKYYCMKWWYIIHSETQSRNVILRDLKMTVALGLRDFDLSS